MSELSQPSKNKEPLAISGAGLFQWKVTFEGNWAPRISSQRGLFKNEFYFRLVFQTIANTLFQKMSGVFDCEIPRYFVYWEKEKKDCQLNYATMFSSHFEVFYFVHIERLVLDLLGSRYYTF